MRWTVQLFSALLLCAGLCGCGSNTAADSEPPPGVRKNEHRSTGVSAPWKGKPFLTGQKERKP